MSTEQSKTPWTPGEWRAEVDAISSVEHAESMRTMLPDYKPSHQYWMVSAWRGNVAAYAAETGCNEYSEANARLISKAPELVEALDEVAAVAELLRHQSGRDVNAFPEIQKARALLQQIREGK